MKNGNVCRLVARVTGLCLVISLISLAALAQTGTGREAIEGLDQFSHAVEALAGRVSPSVVQVLVTRYGVEAEGDRAGLVVTRQEALGSGVIVDSDGYIMTNNHVVEGARGIRIRLVPQGPQTIPSVVEHSYGPRQDAVLLGSFKEGDLALLKVSANNLPALPFADYGKLRQGQVVFALGSPVGLQNSMSMGIVSSMARQLDPDSPFLYIQTDAPINPGSSGGPLVNTAGEIVGLNTSIISQSGGSEGIGFAIPSMLVQWVYDQLRKYGHIHRPVIGVGLQTITPTLAAALRLPRQPGVLVSDVRPGSPADSAGVKINDILLSVDGRMMDNVAAMMGVFFEHGTRQPLRLEMLRGSQQLSLSVTPTEEPHRADRLVDLADPAKSLIPKLGVLGVEINRQTEELVGTLRRASGVIVAARVEAPTIVGNGLQAGDVIHEINGMAVLSVDALRSATAKLEPGDPVALLIERDGKLEYVAFEMD